MAQHASLTFTWSASTFGAVRASFRLIAREIHQRPRALRVPYPPRWREPVVDL